MHIAIPENGCVKPWGCVLRSLHVIASEAKIPWGVDSDQV